MKKKKEMAIYLTNHAKKRAAERLDVKSISSLRHRAALAWQKGVTEETASDVFIKKALEYADSKNKSTIESKLYNGYVFVFAKCGRKSCVLVTVYPFHPFICYKFRNKKIRKIKKFNRMNPQVIEGVAV